MEGCLRISRTMSAGPGPPKSPAPPPPRRGHSVTTERMTRYRSVRSVREHKSMLDFGRNWRDWDVDIFQDDDAASSATTDTGTATSIGICIGLSVEEEMDVDERLRTETSPVSTHKGQQQRPAAAAARRRTAPLFTSFASTTPPTGPAGGPKWTLQWQWQEDQRAARTGDGEKEIKQGSGDDKNNNDDDDDEDENDDQDKDNSSRNSSNSSSNSSSNNNNNNNTKIEGNNNNDGCASDGGTPTRRTGDGDGGKGVPARPASPVRFSYPNRRRPKTVPNAVDNPLHRASSPPPSLTLSPSSSAGGPSPSKPPPRKPGCSLFSLARSSAGFPRPVPAGLATQTPSHALGPCPSVPSMAPASLSVPEDLTSKASRRASDLGAHAPATVPENTPPPPPPPLLEPPPSVPTKTCHRPLFLPLPGPHLRPRSHNPALLSSHSSCVDLKLSARADHARSQIITKLALQPIPDKEPISGEDDHRQRQRQLLQPQSQADEDEEARRRTEREEEDAARWVEEVTRLEAETDRILADEKAKDLARLQAQLDAIPDAPPRLRSPIVDRFASFLRKGRRFDPVTLTKAPSKYFQPLALDCRPVSDMDPTRCIQPGGGGIVPQTDVPNSASNAGERRVTIRCMQSSISLPVTPDTTPNEMLNLAANLMAHRINPKTSIVLEYYFSYGLERRLRRYERVRDVLNSWDRDTQHCLLIVPGASEDAHPDLNIDRVPRTIDPPPGLINFTLYHCNRPRKWSKRYITLTESGQLFASKKKNAKLSDKDTVSLCHLSDFDIYSVTENDMLKNIRSPKKNCLAIKSQQKNSVFQNTERFIHFFASDDLKLVDDFHRIIHGWRSWYLVNKRLDLATKKKPPPLHDRADKVVVAAESKASGGLARNRTVHRSRPSAEETPYTTIGSLAPPLDLDNPDKTTEDCGGRSERPPARPVGELPTPPNSHRKIVPRSRAGSNGCPPGPQKLIDLVTVKDQEFRSAGLLGCGYEGRKQQAEKTAEDHHQHQHQHQHALDGPFTGGQSLLNQVREPDRQLPERRGTVRSARPMEAEQQQQQTPPPPLPLLRSRSRSTTARPKTSDGASSVRREKPQPLVDLMPKMPQLPSAWRDAPGRGVRPPSGKPLIEMATGWDQPDAALGPQLPTVTRMHTTKAYPSQRLASQSSTATITKASLSRSRSTWSTGGGGNGAPRRVVSNEQHPPLPSMPSGLSSQRNDENLPLINFIERDKEGARDPRLRMVRSGTARY